MKFRIKHAILHNKTWNFHKMVFCVWINFVGKALHPENRLCIRCATKFNRFVSPTKTLTTHNATEGTHTCRICGRSCMNKLYILSPMRKILSNTPTKHMRHILTSMQIKINSKFWCLFQWQLNANTWRDRAKQRKSIFICYVNINSSGAAHSTQQSALRNVLNKSSKLTYNCLILWTRFVDWEFIWNYSSDDNEQMFQFRAYIYIFIN